MAKIRSEFAAARYPELLHVTVAVQDGTVTLIGCVSTFHLKQVAQEIAAAHADFFHVENHLRVAASNTTTK